MLRAKHWLLAASILFAIQLQAPAQHSYAPEFSAETQRVGFPADGPVRRFLRRLESGRIWDWAPRAVYHRAAVVVRCPDGSAGSGTIIRVRGNACIVITCAHVVERNRQVGIRFSTGQSATGQQVLSWAEYDLAAVFVPNPPSGYETIPLSPVDPPRGAQVEVMGFGGPDFGSLRPYRAQTYQGQTLAALSIEAPSISGDSGGGMLYQGQLCGVQFGAYTEVNPPPRVGNWSLIYPASSKANTQVLQQFATQACRQLPGGYSQCQPVIGQAPSRPGVDIDIQSNPFYPPEGGQAPAQPPVQQPVGELSPVDRQCLPCKVDYDKIAEEVWDRVGDKVAQGKQGPPGPQGPPGEITEQQISGMVGAIAKQLRNDPSLKGPQGERGPPGEITEQQVNSIVNKVIERLPPRRFVIVNGSDRQVIDDETYAPGEAIVLDVQQIVRAAEQ